MKFAWLIPAVLTLASSAQAASLAEQLPAGALATLEVRDASGLVKRVSGLVGSLAGQFGGLSENDLAAVQDTLNGSAAKEAVVGVFSVGQEGKTFMPHVLGVTRVNEQAAELFAEDLPERPGAFVGKYGFSRQGKTFVGMTDGLLYFSTDKALLMSYLGRLSGKDAPRLMNSGAYVTPTRSVGRQEVSMFLNFSATAKVLRGHLGKLGVPRLFSPVVDAVDTLGQYAGGFTTTEAGLAAVSAKVLNAAGKDKTLYRLSTYNTEFHVQDIIPANVESVKVSACHPETGAYLGRWLTRFDLIEPLGFLTDSQLASHLERSGRYLGDECAQVTLAGGLKSGFTDRRNPLASLNYSVSYRRVTDMQTAKTLMPEYAQSVNEAIAGLSGSLRTLLSQGGLDSVTRAAPRELAGASIVGTQAMTSALAEVDGMLKNLKLVYAFRGDYLITAYSDEALKKALDETPEPLAQSADFGAAGLSMSGAGWTYQPNLPDITNDDFMALLSGMGGLDDLDDLSDDEFEGESADGEVANEAVDAAAQAANAAAQAAAEAADEETADEALTPEELAEQEELKAMQAAVAQLPTPEDDDLDMDAYMNDMLSGSGSFVSVFSDLINRYDGMTAQAQATGNVMVSKANIKYRW